MLGVDMPISTSVGPRLAIRHGIGLVVHAGTQIGSDVTLRQNVTLGSKESGGKAPCIGNGADIGAGALIIGDRTVGDRARIGAGTVVVADVPAGGTVVGNPGRPIGRERQESD
jgi:putative colanic acid biosynthesis acetyltransferase WcaB